MELIQDLHFPSACSRMKLTPDGQHMLASGMHPPQLRVYELAQMSMKFDRHFDSEIVDFQVPFEACQCAAVPLSQLGPNDAATTPTLPPLSAFRFSPLTARIEAATPHADSGGGLWQARYSDTGPGRHVSVQAGHALQDTVSSARWFSQLTLRRACRRLAFRNVTHTCSFGAARARRSLRCSHCDAYLFVWSRSRAARD